MDQISELRAIGPTASGSDSIDQSYWCAGYDRLIPYRSLSARRHYFETARHAQPAENPIPFCRLDGAISSCDPALGGTEGAVTPSARWQMDRPDRQSLGERSDKDGRQGRSSRVGEGKALSLTIGHRFIARQ